MDNQSTDLEIDEIDVPAEAQEADDQTEGDEAEGAGEAEAEEQAEFVVSFGDEEPEEKPEAAPAWVKELRKQNRELKAKVKELETVSAPQHTVAKPKPTLEACDYDADKFETELLAWNAQKAEASRAEQTAKQAWEDRLKTYSEQKLALRVQDYDDAEDAVREVMSVTQQGILLQAADDPAKLVYALGRNPSKAKDLAGEKDPVRFAAKVARLEMQLKVTPRKPAVTPESKVQGSGRTPVSADKVLERLRDEAAKSGDMTKVMAYKRNMKKG